MERKLRKEKWETKVSFQSPERRAHFLYCIFTKKKQKKPMFCKDGLYILLNLHSNQKLCVPCVPIMVCNTIWREVKKKQVEL